MNLFTKQQAAEKWCPDRGKYADSIETQHCISCDCMAWTEVEPEMKCETPSEDDVAMRIERAQRGNGATVRKDDGFLILDARGYCGKYHNYTEEN